MYICPCHSLTSSQLTLPTPHVLKSILYICVFIPVLPLGSSEPFFKIPYICVSIWYLLSEKCFLSSIPASPTPCLIPCLLIAASFQECKLPMPMPDDQFQDNTKAWVGWRTGESKCMDEASQRLKISLKSPQSLIRSKWSFSSSYLPNTGQIGPLILEDFFWSFYFILFITSSIKLKTVRARKKWPIIKRKNPQKQIHR